MQEVLHSWRSPLLSSPFCHPHRSFSAQLRSHKLMHNATYKVITKDGTIKAIPSRDTRQRKR